jgi:hypothetical protein
MLAPFHPLDLLELLQAHRLIAIPDFIHVFDSFDSSKVNFGPPAADDLTHIPAQGKYRGGATRPIFLDVGWCETALVSLGTLLFLEIYVRQFLICPDLLSSFVPNRSGRVQNISTYLPKLIQTPRRNRSQPRPKSP